MASTSNCCRSFLVLLSIFTLTQCIEFFPDLEQIHKHLDAELKPILGKIQNTQCQNDLSAFLRGVKNLDVWAMQMLDASGKWNSGFLWGNIKSLGSYDECVATQESKLQIRGQYCVANLEVKTDNKKIDDLLEVATLKRRAYETRTNRSIFHVPNLLPSMSLIEFGLCVPSSCTPADVEWSLNEIFKKSKGLFVVSEIETCFMKENFVPTYKDMEFMVVITLIILLVIVSSTVELCFGINSSKGFFYNSLMSFSLPTNWSRLTKISNSPSSLKALDGIRILSTLWVILGHKSIYMIQEPWANKAHIINLSQNVVMTPLINNMPSVETFFVLAGMLRAYNLMKEFEGNRFDYFTDFFRRYLRLTPVYALAIGFYATLLPSLGTGPRWDSYVTKLGNACSQNWLSNILYVNNYVHNEKHCMLQTWYLATDMQLFLLAPFVVFILWKKPAVGKIGLSLLVAIPVAYTTWFTFSRHELPTLSISISNEKLLSYLNDVHITMHHRMAPYVIGIGLGCLMHKCKNVRLSWLTVALGWIFCFTTLYAVVFGAYHLVQFDHQYDPTEAALYAGLHRVLWAFAVAWLIFACNNGYGGWITEILSLGIFQPLSKISYCIYLSHYVILMIGIARIKSPIHVDMYSYTQDCLGDLAMCIGVSTILYLTVEAPLGEITSRFFAKAKNIETKKEE